MVSCDAPARSRATDSLHKFFKIGSLALVAPKRDKSRHADRDQRLVFALRVDRLGI